MMATGALASLAAEAQAKNKNIDENNEIQVVESTEVKQTSIDSSLDIDKISDLAKKVAAVKPKLSAVYISEETKKELEKLKLLEEFGKVPIASIATAVLNEFLSMNEKEIRARLRKML